MFNIDSLPYPITFVAEGELRVEKETVRKALDWMKQNRYNYETLAQLLQDYFLTFPNEFDPGGLAFWLENDPELDTGRVVPTSQQSSLLLRCGFFI